MGVLIPLLLIVAIGLLLAGLATGQQALVVACFALSVVTFLLMRRTRDSLQVKRARKGSATITLPTPEDLAAELDGPMIAEPAPKTWPTTEPVVRAEARIDPGTLGRAPAEPVEEASVEAFPEAAVAEAGAPEVAAPEVAAPEQIEERQPEAEAPEAEAPEADADETAAPEPEPAAHTVEIKSEDAVSENAVSESVSQPVQASIPPAAVADDDGWEPDPADEPSMAYTVPPLVSHGGAAVWVIDGRPRYHVSACTFLSQQPESMDIPLLQAVEDGFTPCSVCNPDTALLAQPR